MNKESRFRYEGVKSLYNSLLDIFSCYGVNSDNLGYLKADFESFDNEIRMLIESEETMELVGRFDKFDQVTCYLASDAYNAFENRIGREKATELYNAVISGRHDLLKEVADEC